MRKNNNLFFVTSQAKKLLLENSYDQAHDLAHHLRVWQTAQEINKQLSNKNVDSQVLQVVCLWHDVLVVRAKIFKYLYRHLTIKLTIKHLDHLLFKNNFSQQFRNKVSDSILYHDQPSRAKFIEGKVLYDADKLDSIGLERIENVLKAHQNKQMSKIRFLIYLSLFKQALQFARNRLYFETSKELFDKRMKFLVKDKKIRQLAKNLKLNINQFLVN